MNYVVAIMQLLSRKCTPKTTAFFYYIVVQFVSIHSSVATRLRFGGTFYYHFARNLLLSMSAKEF